MSSHPRRSFTHAARSRPIAIAALGNPPPISGLDTRCPAGLYGAVMPPSAAREDTTSSAISGALYLVPPSRICPASAVVAGDSAPAAAAGARTGAPPVNTKSRYGMSYRLVCLADMVNWAADLAS